MVHVGGGGAAYGVRLYYCTYQDVCFNSVNITSTNTTSGNALRVDGTTSDLNVVNNVLANPGGGYAYYADAGGAAGIATSDYNDLYTSGASLAYWGSAARATLGDLQSASGKDANSISVLPAFYSTTNLRAMNPALDGAATPFAGISEDYDGDPRDPGNPDIGADEFSLVVTLTPQVLNGWNMIGLPLAVADPLKASLYPEAVSNAFAYQAPPVGYTSRDTILNGIGYWLKFPPAASVSLTGAPVLSDTIALAQGWNLIGSIAYPILKTQVAQSSGGLVASNYFAFNGVAGYGSSDTLQPGRAYWVKASAAGNIILDVLYTSGTAPTPPGEEPQDDLAEMDAVTFSVPGTEGQSATVYVALPGSGIEAERFDMPPLPPAGAFDIRFGSNRFGEILPEGGELPVLLQGVSGPVRVAAAAGARATLSLVEKTGQVVSAVHLLAPGRPVTVNPGDGKRYFIAAAGTPVEFSLGQNYPNPFNPSTTLRYSLPVGGTVWLTVHNILGEEVASPVRGETIPAGEHSVEFDASSLPTGAYFCTFRAQGDDGRVFTQSRKMLLMK
jgi:hypothetical protein